MSVGYPKYIEGLKKARLETPPALPPTAHAPSPIAPLLLPLQYQEAWKAAYAKLPTTPLTPLMPLNPFNPFNVTMPEWPKLEMPSTATATTAGAYPTFGAWTPGWPFVQPTASSQASATTGTATVETTPAADATAAAATTPTAQAATTQAAPTALDAKPAAVPTAEATAATTTTTQAAPTAKARGAASLSSRDAYKVVEKAKDIFDDDKSPAKPKPKAD